MINFPHAKINLGLSVVSRGTDGFHGIETIFYPVPLYEAIEITPGQTTGLTITGLLVPGDLQDNLLLRAWHALKNTRPALPPVQIFLHKAIPMGAGLGGGSSDAARLLLMLNERLSLGLSRSELNETAARLGSDCAFFLQNDPCIGTGRGEILEPVTLDLSAYSFLLIHPPVSVSTAWAYQRIRPKSPTVSLRQLIRQSPAEWKETMMNDFEMPVFEAFPQLAEIKSDLYKAGALYAAMSGSGSTLFGIFDADNCPKEGIQGAFRQTFLPPFDVKGLW